MKQKSDLWFEARRGKITGSMFHVIMNGTHNAKQRYMDQLMEELMGNPIKSFSSKATDWGIQNEPKALAAYKLKTGFNVTEHGFVLDPTKNYCGSSPDGLIDDDGGIEIKCPYNQENHMTALVNGMPEKHMAQVQGLMLVTGRKWVDFISYDPRQPAGLDLYIERQHRDEKYISELNNKIIDFHHDMLGEIFL